MSIIFILKKLKKNKKYNKKYLVYLNLYYKSKKNYFILFYILFYF